PNTTCNWRAIIHDSKEATESLRFVDAIRIDLTGSVLRVVEETQLVKSARTGTLDDQTAVANYKQTLPKPQRAESSRHSSESRVQFKSLPPQLTKTPRFTKQNSMSAGFKGLAIGVLLTLSLSVIAIVLLKSISKQKQTADVEVSAVIEPTLKNPDADS